VNAHVKAQALRFVRIAALAFVAQFFAAGQTVSWENLLALVAGAAEVGIREMFPTKAIPTVASVLADPPTPGAEGQRQQRRGV
jgi:hypothetical protein